MYNVKKIMHNHSIKEYVKIFHSKATKCVHNLILPTKGHSLESYFRINIKIKLYNSKPFKNVYLRLAYVFPGWFMLVLYGYKLKPINGL